MSLCCSGLVEKQLRVLLDGLVASVPDFHYTLRMAESRAPYEIDEGHPFVRLFDSQAQSVLGERPAVVAGTYWTDSALLSEKGIPTLLFGVQGEGAHAARESASIGSIEQVTNIFTRTIVDFCK